MIEFFLNFLPEKSPFLNLFSYLSTRTILATLTGLIIVIFFGDYFINKIRSLQFKQSIGDRGPESHKAKDGTPTMGGLLVVGAVIFSGLLWGDLSSKYILISLFCLISFGLIGFVDDYKKIQEKNSKGISSQTKLFYQFIAACTISIALFMTASSEAEYSYIVPFFKDVFLDFGFWFVFISIFILVGSSNAVNLTDGLDGLATVPVILVAGCFSFISYLSGNIVFSEYLQILYIEGTGEISIFCGAIIGSCLGFLWFNAPPAKIFMGDTGSLSLGGSLGAVGIITKHEIVLAITGGLFVLEALSVMVQVISFKLTGKRIFKMAPIHHHFEKKGWPESTVVIRFWIISIILALIGLASLKLR